MNSPSQIEQIPKADWSLCILAIGLGILGKILIGWHAPFWLDETYSGVIAGQPDIAHWLDWTLHELSGPSYYALLWVWEKIAGNSDLALRLPSFLLSLAILPVIWFGSDSPKRTRLFWMALAALWLPGMYYATQARPQAMLLLLATMQVILFVRAYRQPDLRNFSIWAAITALMLVTHLYAVIPGGLQGLTLLWRSKGQWKTLWPAALAFVPAFAWLLLQAPFMLEFAKPQNSWYPLKSIGELADLGWEMAAFPILAEISLLLIGLALIRPEVKAVVRPPDVGRLCPEVAALCIGFGSVLIMFAIGMIRPSYDSRYLMPCIPGILLGMAFILVNAREWARLLAPVTVMLFMLAQCVTIAVYGNPARQEVLYPLQFQSASQWLIGNHSQRILFAWDNQAAAINSDERLAEVGDFFFARAHRAAEIIVVRKDAKMQWSENLLRQSRLHNADIIWLGGKDHPAKLLAEPALECRRWGHARYSQSVACKRLPLPSD